MTVLHVYWKGDVEWRVIDAFAHQLSLNQMEILKDSLRWRGGASGSSKSTKI